MSVARGLIAALVGALSAWALHRVWPAGAVAVVAGGVSLGILRAAGSPLGRAWIPAVLAALAALGLRWTVMATMTPAYPPRAALFAGAEVAAAIVAVVLAWTVLDARASSAPKKR